MYVLLRHIELQLFINALSVVKTEELLIHTLIGTVMEG